MDNNDVKVLVEAFKGYRDLLDPIQSNLCDFIDTYEQMRGDIDRLNSSFSGDVKGNLESIYKNLSVQADKASDLSGRIDHFIKITNKYTTDITKIITMFEQVESNLLSVTELENKAEQQIGKLDAILEEKKKNYNLKELKRTLDNYNENVQKVSEFINLDVAEALTQNNIKLESLKSGNENLYQRIEKESASIDKLIESYSTTNILLKNMVDKESVNEEYIFEILDKWAQKKHKRKK